MDLFGGALTSITSGTWTSRITPPMASVSIPAMGSVDIPEMGAVTIPDMPVIQMPAAGAVEIPDMPFLDMPDMGWVTIPEMGQVQIPEMGSVVIPDPGQVQIPDMPTSIFAFNQAFSANIGALVGGLTGTSSQIVSTPASFNTKAIMEQINMPAWTSSPFMSAGLPNPFFGAQFFGNCSTFYSAFGGALSTFRQA